MELASPVGRDLILFLLYTGFRRREATTLRWSDVDLEARVIRLAAATTKSKRTLELPMSDLVHDLLERRREVGDAGWVFPANSQERPRRGAAPLPRAGRQGHGNRGLGPRPAADLRLGGREHGDVGLRAQGPGQPLARRRRHRRLRPALRRAAQGPRPAGGRRAEAALSDRLYASDERRLV